MCVVGGYTEVIIYLRLSQYLTEGMHEVTWSSVGLLSMGYMMFSLFMGSIAVIFLLEQH